MIDLPLHVRLLITRSFPRVMALIPRLFLTGFLLAQAPDPAQSIRDLKEGTLIIRFPAYKTKIDTLNNMISRSTDPKQKTRLEKELKLTMQERDTLFADYIHAFKTVYTFSAVAYIYDFESRDMNTASYYNLDGERMVLADLSEKPMFYLFFDRSEEKSMDALVVKDRMLKKIPRPFPNDFTLGGINTIFLGLSGKKFPTWRVSKINKRFHMYLTENTEQ